MDGIWGNEILAELPELKEKIKPREFYGERDLQRVLGIHKKGLAYVVGIVQAADKGKSLFAVFMAFYLVANCGYKCENVWSNVPISMPGAHYVKNEEIRDKIMSMVVDELEGMIFIVDELDSVFPARAFKDEIQTRALSEWNQATKRRCWIFGITHLGTGGDKLVRDAVQIGVIPEYVPEEDRLYLYIVNGVDIDESEKYIENISFLFDLYNRWESPKWADRNRYRIGQGNAGSGRSARRAS